MNGFNPWVGKIPENEMEAHSSILTRKIPQRSHQVIKSQM